MLENLAPAYLCPQLQLADFQRKSPIAPSSTPTYSRDHKKPRATLATLRERTVVPRSACELPRMPDCASPLAATEPMPSSHSSMESSECMRARIEQPVKAYMRPTASYLAKRRSRKSPDGKSGLPKQSRVCASSIDSSNPGKTESLASVTETVESGWEISVRPSRTPLSDNIVEEWLAESNYCSKDDIGETKKICLARSEAGDGWVVVGRGDSSMDYTEQRAPEVLSVNETKRQKNKRRFMGHVCSFLLGIGTMTLIGVLN